MMKDQEKTYIDIKIAGEPIKLLVPFDSQDFTRDVEREVTSLFAKWKHSFSSQTEKSVLARMVYQYASYYRELKIKYEEAVKKAEECLGKFDTEL